MGYIKENQETTFVRVRRGGRGKNIVQTAERKEEGGEALSVKQIELLFLACGLKVLQLFITVLCPSKPSLVDELFTILHLAVVLHTSL